MVAVLVTAPAVFVLAAPPVAALEAPTDDATEEDATEEGAEDEAEAPPVSDQEAFVDFDPNPVAEAEVPAWTYRFLVPLFITITILFVVGTGIQYFNKVVRARYEPVE